MENSFQTSFIPKKPVTSSVSIKEPRSLFSFLAIFAFITSILIAGGLFLYKGYLLNQQESFSSSLSIARNSFEKNTIDELDLFNRRTESIKIILGDHIVLSPMFQLLGDITIPQIQYTSFEQQSSDKGFLVSVQGLARDYRSIALQAGMFNSTQGSPFKNVLFYDLTKDKNNNISFNLKFSIDPALVSYKNNISAEPVVNSNTLLDDSGNQIQ